MRSPGASFTGPRWLARGEFDLVAVGRALVANPDWPELVRRGRTDELRNFEAGMLTALD